MKGTVLFATLAVASTAFAGPRDFVVVHTYEGGTQQQAQPFLDKFLGHVENTLGWPAKSTSGQFFPEYPDPAFATYLADKKPGYGMFDPEIYLELRKKEGLVPLASVDGKGKALGHLHLVVKDPALKKLEDLKGKVLASNHLQSPRFTSKVAFEGKIDVTKHFAKADAKLSLLKALKAVEAGEAQAALVSDEDEEWRKASAYSGLTVIWSSPALPKMVVAAFGKSAAPKDKDAFAKALPTLCDAKGADVCKEMGINKFIPLEKAALDAAAKRFESSRPTSPDGATKVDK
jgi:ABC-type phosphate/phosphonate transport system substrate-binding protein